MQAGFEVKADGGGDHSAADRERSLLTESGEGAIFQNVLEVSQQISRRPVDLSEQQGAARSEF